MNSWQAEMLEREERAARKLAATYAEVEKWKALAGRQHEALADCAEELPVSGARPDLVNRVDALLADPDGAAAMADLTALREERDTWRGRAERWEEEHRQALVRAVDMGNEALTYQARAHAAEARLAEIAVALGYPVEVVAAPCNVLAHTVRDLARNCNSALARETKKGAALAAAAAALEALLADYGTVGWNPVVWVGEPGSSATSNTGFIAAAQARDALSRIRALESPSALQSTPTGGDPE